ncbi:di-heme-cytochrome C peroxidase [Massilia sp. TWR1-2-2]|uniref:di-heme-cytochrome C peroxidase n=1 Tax=Massilia sp. TWR1-2-2 TaxID=2804584 RepID=UPI003CEE1CA2
MGFINVSLGGALVALAALGAAAVSTPELVPVDQGWTIAEKAQWHSLSQGSRLIPRAWLMALERPDVDRPFLQPSHIDSFRYLIDPTPLPVGFVVDDQSDRMFSDVSRLRWKKGQGEREAWVGMNCAACHTAELTFKGKRMRIEGAPALADFQSFMQSMNGALATVLRDQRKWDRFSGQVLAGADDAGNRSMLRDAVESMLRWQTRVEQANHTDLQYGFARVDAFGHIFNNILLKTGGAGQPINPSDAPVSYPFLWNTSQHDVVQWNGMASNQRIGAIDIGALGRNVGEVTGVFADLAFTAPGTATARNGYQTSAHVKNLLTLDTLVRKLKAPAWPEALPPIDADKWEAGKLLFNQANGCASCHQVLARDDLSTRFVATLTPVFGSQPLGTDPWMACNAYAYQAMTGVLYNTRERLFIGRRYGQVEQLSDLLGTTVIGAIFNRRDEVIDAAVDRRDIETILVSANFFNWGKPLSLEDASAVHELFEPDKEKRLQRCMKLSDDSRMAYKGRPLTGVWATAPYLHNGSVPTLYDLLLPPERRPRSFRLGTREFDPGKVGFVTGETAENSFVFAPHDASGQAIAGNSNLGHDYGNAGFSDAQRWALVEYMKAVGARREGSKIIQ